MYVNVFVFVIRVGLRVRLRVRFGVRFGVRIFRLLSFVTNFTNSAMPLEEPVCLSFSLPSKVHHLCDSVPGTAYPLSKIHYSYYRLVTFPYYCLIT